MNGSKFVKLLQDFELPGSENLVSSDYDWIFLQKENKNLSKFWEYFAENFRKSDLLSEKELHDYNELVKNGLALSSEELRDLEEDLSHHHNGANNFLSLFYSGEESEEEKQKRIEEEKLLQQRLDHVMLQKMEIKERIEHRKENVKHLEHRLEKENKNLQPVFADLAKSKQELFSYLQNSVKPYENFSEVTESPAFLSQFSLSKWHEEEEKFLVALKKYIDKQFAEGVVDFENEGEDKSELLESLLNSKNSSRNPKEEKFIKDSRELNRITKMLEEATIDEATAQIDQHRKEAEIAESRKLLNMLNEKSFSSSVTILEEQLKESEELNEAHTHSLNQQMDCIKEKARVIAQTERTNALLSDYKGKIKRQEAFLNKQKEIIEEFAGQLARYDALKILFDIEKKNISDNFKVFHTLGSHLCDDEQRLLHQESSLKELLKESQSDKFLRSRRELQTLERLQTPADDAGDSKAQNSLEDYLKESQSTEESKLTLIQNLLKGCSLMKHSLFGGDKLPSSLPPTWVRPGIAEEQRHLQESYWELQQKMVSLFKDIQLKKQNKSLA